MWSQVFHRSNLLLLTLLCCALWMVWHAPSASDQADQLFGVGEDRLMLDGMRGRIVRFPERSDENQRLVVEAEIELSDNQQRLYRIHLYAPTQHTLHAGDWIQFSCPLNRPKPFDGFAYDQYLYRYGITGSCFVRDLEIIGHTATPLTHVLSARSFLEERLLAVMPMPYAGILLGIVFGEPRILPEELAQAFRITGTSHLLVISGSNVSIIIGWLSAVLQRFLRRGSAAVWIITAIILYTFATGLQPSASRAAVFGSFILLSQLFGRPDAALRGLLYTGLIMTIWNPLMPIIDAGFQLSFLASLGMILWSGVWKERLWWLPAQFGFREGFSSTLSASIITLPLVALQFETVSLVSLVANLFLVPLLSAFLPIGIMLTIIASVSHAVGFLLAMPITALVALSIHAVYAFASLPYATLETTTVPQIIVFLWYAVIIGYAFMSTVWRTHLHQNMSRAQIAARVDALMMNFHKS